MRSLRILVAGLLAIVVMGIGGVAASADGRASAGVDTGGGPRLASTCRVAPTGIIGGSYANRQSPMVVNNLGAVGSGREVPACVAWVNAVTGKRTVSAPIFTYADVSDEQPVYVVTGDSLWIYEVATTRGPELLRISNVTHEVLQRLAMPAFIRPTIAADAMGFWIGLGPDGGSALSALYFVPQGAARPQSVLSGSRYEGIDRICVAGADAWIKLLVGNESTSNSVGYRVDRPGDVVTPEGVDPFADCPIEYQTFGSPQN